MAVLFENFPVKAVVDCLLSYTRYLFEKNGITPGAYRFNDNEREQRIRISAPFSIDNEKPLSAPFIVIERGTFQFQNIGIDNFRGADANAFENPQYTDIADGIISVIVGSGTASEASNIANFLAMMYQADRHEIMANSKFIRNLNYIDISPEMPVMKGVEVRRWEVIIRLQASIQMAWIKKEMQPILWKSAAIYSVDGSTKVFSNQGIISNGESTLTDASQNFGFLSTNSPQFHQTDFDRGWYYVRFKENENKQLYTITEVINSNTIKLQTHDEDNNPVDWVSDKTSIDVEYDLYWNSLHIYMEVPQEEP